MLLQLLKLRRRNKGKNDGTQTSPRYRSTRRWCKSLNVVDQFNLDAPKTKLLAEKVRGMGLDSVLIILDEVSENLYLAARNLHKVAVVEPQHADPLSLVQFQKVLVSKAAIAKMEELLK